MGECSLSGQRHAQDRVRLAGCDGSIDRTRASRSQEAREVRSIPRCAAGCPWPDDHIDACDVVRMPVASSEIARMVRAVQGHGPSNDVVLRTAFGARSRSDGALSDRKVRPVGVRHSAHRSEAAHCATLVAPFRRARSGSGGQLEVRDAAPRAVGRLPTAYSSEHVPLILSTHDLGMNVPYRVSLAAGQASAGMYGPRRRRWPRVLRQLAAARPARSHALAALEGAEDSSRIDRLIDLFEHTTCDCL